MPTLEEGIRPNMPDGMKERKREFEEGSFQLILSD